MSRAVCAVLFVACLAGAVAHKALGITHGATIALIVGAVLAFAEAMTG